MLLRPSMIAVRRGCMFAALALTFAACGGSETTTPPGSGSGPTATPVLTLSASTVAASPSTLVANGTSTSTITVQLRDAAGQPFTTAINGAVTFDAPSLGAISTATDRGLGAWTATYTAGITAGTTTIAARFNGTAIAGTAAITLTANTSAGSNEPAWLAANWEVPTATDLPPSCTTTTPMRLTPVDLGQLSSINGRGFVQPGLHNTPTPHLTMNVLPANGAVDEQGHALVTKRLDVSAPADGVVMGGSSTQTTSGGFTYTEYAVGIHVCGTRWISFNHLDGLSTKLATALTPATTPGHSACITAADGTKTCTFDGLNIPLGVSEKIGRTSGRTYGFDFAAVNTASPSPRRLNPKAWLPRWVASACPIQWFPTNIAADFFALIRTEGDCGDYAYDVAGSASGVWLSTDNLTNAMLEERDLTVANDYAVASQRMFSVGTQYTIPGLPSKIYYLTPIPTGTHNTDFASVKPGDVICYDQLRARGPGENGAIIDLKIFIKVTAGSPETLQIGSAAGQCGTGPYAMPAATATFARTPIIP